MERNCDILRYILKYCEGVIDSIKFFGDDYSIFCENSHYRNDVSMCLMQIGELSKKLSNEFKESTSEEIPWREIRGMRNLFAHVYPTMSVTEIFATAHDEIPHLKEFCEKQLKNIELLNQDSIETDWETEEADDEPEP